MDAIRGISVTTLARAKGLCAEILRMEFGLADTEWYGQPAVRVPYRDGAGVHRHDKLRLGDGTMRYAPQGATPALYGLDRVARVANDAMVLLAEGESDVWTAAFHDLYAVGIPGASAWRPDFAAHVRRFPNLVIWEEPGEAAQQLVIAIARDLPDARVIRGGDAKDLSELHQQAGAGFALAFAARMAAAEPLYDRALALVARAPVRVIRHRRYSSALSRYHQGEADPQLEAARRQSTVDVLVARGARLRGRGLWQQTRCPFPDHDDRIPSFAVHVMAGRWRCMGCGRHGTDAIALVQQLDGVTFREAVAEVAR